MGETFKSEILTNDFVSDRDLQLYNYGFQKCHKGHSWGPGIKDHIKLHTIIKGKGRYSVDGNNYLLRAGDVFLSLPHKVIFYEADNVEPWEYTWVSFEGIKAKDYILLSGLTEKSPVINIGIEKSELIKHSVLELIDMTKKFPTSELIETSYLYKVLGILQKAKEVVSIANSAKEGYVKNAMDFVNMNYSSSISCSRIAEHVGVHRKYLTKLFNEYLDVTPQGYLIKFRMNRAIELLKTKKLTVSEIGFSVGYKDPQVFSKTFKRVYGVSPTNYKT